MGQPWLVIVQSMLVASQWLTVGRQAVVPLQAGGADCVCACVLLRTVASLAFLQHVVLSQHDGVGVQIGSGVDALIGRGHHVRLV